MKSYRAPSFSITRQSEWALDVLAEQGIEIDSSIFPVRHDRYGLPGAEPTIHIRKTNNGPLLEFPPSAVRTNLGTLPACGGGYFRLYPARVTDHCIRSIHRMGRPCMFYVHPWEIDPDQPRLPSSSRLRTWRHRVNLKSTYGKLDRLLGKFHFGTISQSIAAYRQSHPTLCASR